MSKNLQQLKDKQLQEFEKEFIKTSMWELVPNTPRKIMAQDIEVAKLMSNIKSFLTHSIELAYEEGKKEKTNE